MSKSMLPIEPAQNIHPERRPDDAMERPARISKPDELLQVIEVLGRKVLTQNPQRLFSYAVHTFAGLLATPVCSLWLMDEDSHELLLAASCNWPGSAITKDYRLPWDSFIGRTLATKRLRILDDARSNPEFADPKLAREQDWRSALAVPILCLDGSVMGADHSEPLMHQGHAQYPVEQTSGAECLFAKGTVTSDGTSDGVDPHTSYDRCS